LRPLHLVLAVAALTSSSNAEGPTAPLDLETLPPERRFDFLVGTWTYEFSSGRGTTVYRHSANREAIHEVLSRAFLGEREFSAVSLFFRDEVLGEWRHRWADTLGNQLDARGGMVHDEVSPLPSMQVEFEHQGKAFRHLWYDITPDRFETDLLVSSDGEHFELVRRMPFRRIDAADRSCR